MSSIINPIQLGNLKSKEIKEGAMWAHSWGKVKLGVHVVCYVQTVSQPLDCHLPPSAATKQDPWEQLNTLPGQYSQWNGDNLFFIDFLGIFYINNHVA